jgi:hypothetical protein
VAEISRHDTDYIWHWMAYAQGLQFCTAWCQVHDVAIEQPATARPSLKVVI